MLPSADRTQGGRGAPQPLAAPSRPRAVVAKPQPGFTLLELLLVMGLIAALAGLSWPALRGPLEKHRLRSAATAVTTHLGRARLLAIETGRPVEFQVAPGQGRYRLTQAPADFAHLLANPVNRPSAATQPLDDVEQLPRGIVFVEPAPAEGAADEGFATEASDSAPAGALAGLEDWGPAVVFLPDGTTRDARWELANERGWRCAIALRGLTGAARPEAVRRPESGP